VISSQLSVSSDAGVELFVFYAASTGFLLRSRGQGSHHLLAMMALLLLAMSYDGQW